MTPQELSANLNKVNQIINSDYPQWASVAIGQVAFGMLKTRIQKSGKGPDGAPFKPYSTKPSLIGAKSFRTETNAAKYFGSKQKRSLWPWVKINTPKGMRNVAVLSGGYKMLRIIDGQQAAFKDFTRTEEMWLSIHVMGTTGGNGKYVTTIGSTNELTNKKLQGHFKREGKEILNVTKKEEAELNRIFDKYITKIVERAING